MSSRRRGHAFKGDLKRVLLDATLALLSEGIDPSLRAVARHAGVASSAPYHHFENRGALLACVAAEGFDALIQALTPTQEQLPSTALHRRVALYVRFAAEHGAHYRVMFDPRLNASEHPELDQSARAAFSHLVAAVAAVGGQHDAVARAFDVWAMAHGQVLLYLDGVSHRLLPGDGLDALARRTGDAAVRLAAPTSD